MPQQPSILKQEILFNAGGNERIKFWKLNRNLSISTRALAFGKSSSVAASRLLLSGAPSPCAALRVLPARGGGEGGGGSEVGEPKALPP